MVQATEAVHQVKKLPVVQLILHLPNLQKVVTHLHLLHVLPVQVHPEVEGHQEVVARGEVVPAVVQVGAQEVQAAEVDNNI